MSTLTIRNIDTDTMDKLRLAAAANGRSMEEEVRTILRSALSPPAAATGLGSRLHARFAGIGGVDLSQPERTEPAPAADFGNAASGGVTVIVLDTNVVSELMRPLPNPALLASFQKKAPTGPLN